MTTLLPGYILEGMPAEVPRGASPGTPATRILRCLAEVEVFVPPYTATATATWR